MPAKQSTPAAQDLYIGVPLKPKQEGSGTDAQNL